MFLNEAKGQLMKMLKTRLNSDISFYERMLKVSRHDLDELARDPDISEYGAAIKNEIGSYKRRIEVAKRYLRDIEDSRKNKK